jgi:hypothetical protein
MKPNEDNKMTWKKFWNEFHNEEYHRVCLRGLEVRYILLHFVRIQVTADMQCYTKI